jgi:hypothetical protein
MAEASASFYTTFGNLTKAICVKAHIAGVRPLLFEFLRTFPMAIFQQTLPASIRLGSQNPQENRGISNSDRRPYLVSVPTRRSTPPTRQTASSRQFFALFPHESEDARITGSTRSLYRRLLALNLPCKVVARKDPSMDTLEATKSEFKLIDTHIA